MRYRLFLILFLLVALGWVFLHKSIQGMYFIPFDEAQIQEHHTPKDLSLFYQRLHKKKWRLLNRLYKNHLAGRTKRQKKERIPKIIHQIWLGSPFPEKYKKIQQTWIDHHPDWEYHLWTDETIAHLYLQNHTLFEAATNVAQKADILRYEILYQFGGLYADADFECLKPFDILNENCDFYAGVSDQIRSPQICNSLIASIPGHPILRKCIQELRGKKPSKIYMGPTFLTRCFFVIAKNKESHANVILPATFFYPISSHQGEDSIQDNTFAIRNFIYNSN